MTTMPNTTGYEFGNVVLVAFPFTNQHGSKQRPAAVVSSQAYNQSKPDVILMAITSQVKAKLAFAETPIEHWQTAGLLKFSIIKPIMFTMEINLISKGLGHLSELDRERLRRVLTLIVG